MVKYGWLFVHLRQGCCLLDEADHHWQVLMSALCKSGPKKALSATPGNLIWMWSPLPSFVEIGFASDHILGAIFMFFMSLSSFLDSRAARLFKSVLPLVRGCWKFTQVHNYVSLSFIIFSYWKITLIIMTGKANEKTERKTEIRVMWNTAIAQTGPLLSKVLSDFHWRSSATQVSPKNTQTGIPPRLISPAHRPPPPPQQRRSGGRGWGGGVRTEGRVKRVRGRSSLQPGLEAGGNLLLG